MFLCCIVTITMTMIKLYKHIIHIYIYICIQKHNDTIIKTSEDFFKKYIYLSLYLKGLCVRGSWRPSRTATYWPPLLWPSALCLSRSPDAQPEARGPAFCWVLAFSTTSCLQLLVSKTNWLPVFTELYNSSIANSIFGMACLIVIKRK